MRQRFSLFVFLSVLVAISLTPAIGQTYNNTGGTATTSTDQAASSGQSASGQATSTGTATTTDQSAATQTTTSTSQSAAPSGTDQTAAPSATDQSATNPGPTTNTPTSTTTTTSATIYNGGQNTGNTGTTTSGKSDISVQLTGLFTRHSNGAFVNHFATDSAGVLVGYRYHFNAWNAAEVNYGYSHNSQRYLTGGTASPSPTIASIPSRIHELSANYVFTAPVFTIQPFLLGGGGAVLFDPTSFARAAYPGVRWQGRGMFDYGGGVDFRIMHVGFRAEYRGLLFKIPNYKFNAFNANRWTHVAQPSVGVVFTF